MSASYIILSLIAFSVFSIVYVYRYRGVTRYANFSEYLRKGWPIFAPYNCLLYLFTKRNAHPPIIDAATVANLAQLQEHWPTIQQEAQELLNGGGFDDIADKDSASYYDVGFRTFYKYGWRKFYLNWYGYTHQSAKQTCPKTIEILSQIPCINGAMFSILPPGSELTRHLDPVACSLRYHLGLDTPESDSCFINIDGQNYAWKNGEALLFDVTYLHYAQNNSDKNRLILMCDIERPMNWLGHLINWPYKLFMRLSIVPNTPDDKRGFANKVFKGVVPILEWSKNLKTSNLVLYKTLKYIVNTSLLLAVVALLWGILKAIQFLLF